MKNSNNRIRTGAPTSFAKHAMALSTTIEISNKDARGYKINTATSSDTLAINLGPMQPYRVASTDNS
jgi:transcription initiation factor TFIIIB Brf1 subunit/transcription initiation factor TFIIB